MGRIGNVVFDAPGTTLEQYARGAGSIALDMMSMPERIVDTPDRVEIARADGDKPNLAFQHSASPLRAGLIPQAPSRSISTSTSTTRPMDKPERWRWGDRFALHGRRERLRRSRRASLLRRRRLMAADAPTG